MFMFSRKDPKQPAGARGYRAYVVGDVHGRLDLLEALLDRIHGDIANREPIETVLVFVGDLIDRGPASAGVIERLRTYEHPGVRPVFLLGNHEEVLLRILAGDASLIPNWLRFGGAQCLVSYGGDPKRLAGQSHQEAVATVRDAIPDNHASFLREFIDTFRFGDYLIVHAGIRPGIALEEQRQSDRRPRKRDGVAGLNFIEQAGHHARQRQRPSQAEGGADGHHRQCPAKHQPENRR